MKLDKTIPTLRCGRHRLVVADVGREGNGAAHGWRSCPLSSQSADLARGSGHGEPGEAGVCDEVARVVRSQAGDVGIRDTEREGTQRHREV